MVTELQRLQLLIGKHLPVGDAEPVDYTDAELAAFLAAVPQCELAPYGSDVYLAAARVWDDKALQQEVSLTIAGGEAHKATSVRQGAASVTYSKPVAVGSTTTAPNDPAAMRALAARLRRKSCNGGVFKALDVAPPNVVQPGRRDRLEYDGGDSLYTEPRRVVLDPVNNPDRAVNLPEVDS